jgi:hypothetical protein
VASLDESGLPRKALADDCSLSEPELSKALSVQRFDLRWLDALPPVVALEFLGKYARAKFGATVRTPEPEDLLRHVLAQVNGLVAEVRQAQTIADLRRKGAA